MGLDTSHECWHGSYGSFSRWRTELARVAGYKINPPQIGQPGYDLPWDEFEDKNYQGEWNGSVPGDDPLLFLLVHSDCDGVIHPEQGIHIARRLEQLLPLLDDTTENGHISPSMRGKTQQFIDGLRTAADAGEDVVFH
jgi:hypothetical protein